MTIATKATEFGANAAMRRDGVFLQDTVNIINFISKNGF